jgi:hypothetical protein
VYKLNVSVIPAAFLPVGRSLSRNPVFSIVSGCPIKDFGHDTNKNSNLYTDTNYRKKLEKERDRGNFCPFS